MVNFVVQRDGVTTAESVYDVDPLVDTANPFGDYCVIKLDDRGGEKFDNYNRGTRFDVFIEENDQFDDLRINPNTTQTTTDTKRTGGTITNQGTYSNQGTVSNELSLAFRTLDIIPSETVSTTVFETDRYGSTISNQGTYSNQGTVAVDSPSPKFTGYVVEARETEQSGADALEVEAYTFDQFLRRNTVSTDQTGNTIAEALESIVTNDTPVSYVASNIEVVNEQELTRSYRGEPVEVVLRDLAFKSGNEAFGVNDNREFFFRPRETKHIDRGIDNTQWFNYDIPELGKDAINEVEVFFNNGNKSVVIDSPTDKLELQDGLSLPEPGTQREELNRPLVTDIQDAEDIGRQYLQFRNATLSGTVTTFGLYDAEPGDTINITIKSRGIDTEFRIAAVEYRWGRDETILTVVERRGDQDKILSRISESVKRQEMETADRDAPSNRITTTEANAIVDVTVEADGNTPDGTRFVNPGRNAVRDAWAGDGNPDISNIAIGSGGSGLSRSNTDLNNQVTSASATESLPTSTSAEYSASITQTGVEEIGLTTSGGTLIARAVFDAPVDLAGTVTVTLDVSNDNSVQRGVLTNDGQTAVRDVLADNSPALPTDYTYGSDGSAVSESDTSLSSQLKQVSLSKILVQDANTDSEWSSITSLDANDPFVISNGELQLAQTSFNNDLSGAVNDSMSGGEGQDFQQGAGSNNTISITLDYETSNLNFYARLVDTSGTDEFISLRVVESGSVVGSTISPPSTLGWKNTGTINKTYTPGSYTFTFETDPNLNSSGSATVDLIAVVDDRFTYTFDNTDLSTVSRDYLEGPELFPSGAQATLDLATSRRNISEGTFNSTWKDNDVSGAQAIEVSPDGSTFQTFSNTTSGSYSFTDPTQEITTRFTFDRYGSRTTTTPTSGFKGQAVDLWELFVNPDTPSPDDIGVTNARAIVPPNTSGITGNTVREAGLKSGNILLTHHQLAEFVLETDQRLASSETTRFKGTE